ncbi:hypothetical protein SDC9_144931 [bioreactor metagenome]|uniref:Uncharacterized protein n=1 Tax=bioreactor metagenome TaxID=1076179 RepID=A0A645E7B3_9ZZZZ
MYAQRAAHGIGRHGRRAGDRDDAGIGILGHAPHVQVGDLHTRKVVTDHVAHLLHHGRVHLGIQQNAARLPQQTPGPHGPQHAADQAHCRVQPLRAVILAAQQRDDGQHRRGGIGHDVQIGGAQVHVFMRVIVVVVVTMVVMVVVVMPMPMSMCMSVMIMMVVRILEQPRAQQIHRQAQGCNRNRLVVVDGLGAEQPLHRLHQHQQRHHAQQ